MRRKNYEERNNKAVEIFTPESGLLYFIIKASFFQFLLRILQIQSSIENT